MAGEMNKRCGNGKQIPAPEVKQKQWKCTSRNAVMARVHRLKKKRFLESLQKDLAQLSDENSKLKEALEDQTTLASSLRKEVHYLKSVLANSTEIGMLLKSLKKNTDLPMSSSLSRRTAVRKAHSIKSPTIPLDHNYVCPSETDSSCGSELGLYANYDYMPLLIDNDRSDDYTVQPAYDESPLPLNKSKVDNGEILGDVGVCLHVAKRKVSLEFCATCSNNAQSALQDLDVVQ